MKSEHLIHRNVNNCHGICDNARLRILQLNAHLPPFLEQYTKHSIMQNLNTFDNQNTHHQNVKKFHDSRAKYQIYFMTPGQNFKFTSWLLLPGKMTNLLHGSLSKFKREPWSFFDISPGEALSRALSALRKKQRTNPTHHASMSYLSRTRHWRVTLRLT